MSLGIGANSAIFNLLQAVLLRGLPVPQAEQLRIVMPVTDGDVGEAIYWYPVLTEMAAHVKPKASIAGYSSILDSRLASGQDAEQQTKIQLVTGSFFQALRVGAQVGRMLNASDDRSTGNFPAVLSDSYWTSHFGRDISVVGRQLWLNGAPVTVAGVAAYGFFGIEPGERPDFWLPVSAQQDVRYKMNFWNSNGNSEKPFILQPQIRWLGVVARIPDPRSEPLVLSGLNQVYARDMKREAASRDATERARLLRTRLFLDSGAKGLSSLRDRFAEPLQVLMGAVGLVLLIAGVNLASLALARVIARTKEIAIRCSVGAGRARVFSQLMAETALLSFAGALISVPVALWGGHLLLRWASKGDPIPIEIGINTSLVLFIVGAAAAVGLLFGLLPAMQAMRFSLANALKATASSVKGIRMPWGRTLIAAQVAFSFVLLAGAVLFVRTLMNYSAIPLGYVPQQVLSVRIDPLGGRYDASQLPELYHRLLDGMNAVPGVQSVALAICELADNSSRSSGINIPGNPALSADSSLQWNEVTPGYFQTVGMRLVSGRAFTWQDRGGPPVLAVVNKSAADRYFGGGTKAIGQYFGNGGDNHRYQVIGIIADARINNIHQPSRPAAYFSLVQQPDFVSTADVLTRADAQTMATALRAAIRTVDPHLPVTEIRPLTHFVDDNLLRERLLARLASVFAVLALALACLGVYGVLSYTIVRRTSEIGIRLALGAEPGSVRWMVLREALLVLAIGLLAGVPSAIGLIRFVDSLLYGLKPTDPLSLTLSTCALLLAGTAAAFIPAWRASRVDPLTALRYE